jgi:osmotically-inducible protein OsmY
MRNAHLYILTALAAMLFAGQPAQAMSNQDLKTKVQTTLERYYIQPFNVRIEGAGNVVLEGKVPTCWDRYNIFDIVSRTPGVKEISDRLQVNTQALPDNEVKDKIRTELDLNRAIVEPGKIRVDVNNGVVILKGTVSFFRESKVAQDVASWEPGVKDVVNELRVRPTEKAFSDENLTNVLREAVVHFFPLEKNTVQVQVNDGRASLTGTVTTMWARNHIESEARHVLGIYEVKNLIQVVPEL